MIFFQRNKLGSLEYRKNNQNQGIGKKLSGNPISHIEFFKPSKQGNFTVIAGYEQGNAMLIVKMFVSYLIDTNITSNVLHIVLDHKIRKTLDVIVINGINSGIKV